MKCISLCVMFILNSLKKNMNTYFSFSNKVIHLHYLIQVCVTVFILIEQKPRLSLLKTNHWIKQMWPFSVSV